jgi:hypothetical protein
MESRLAFSTESTSTLLDMEPSETVKFLAGPTHGLSLIRGFFLARAIIEQKKITTDQIGELKERYIYWLWQYERFGCNRDIHLYEPIQFTKS